MDHGRSRCQALEHRRTAELATHAILEGSSHRVVLKQIDTRCITPIASGCNLHYL